MIVHRSLKVNEEMWRQMEEKARARGFSSTNSYVKHVIQEDLGTGTLEETEQRIVSTISKLSAQIQSLATMHQASFSTIWALLELIVEAGQPSDISDKRLKDLRVRIASDTRTNVLTDLTNGAIT